MSGAATETSGATPAPIAWRQIARISAVALAVFAVLRWLPTGTNLSHMDFRATGGNSIEFCDPLNPQFISVVAVRSPVTMTLDASPGTAGREVSANVILRTGSGKPIAPEDLLVTHTRRLHLLLIDPTLTDYQHVHPEPGAKPGEWRFTFTPRLPGLYRIFADFTPAATARGLYASVDWQVGAGAAVSEAGGQRESTGVVERDGYRFTLGTGSSAFRAGVPGDLSFAIVRTDGRPVPMEPVMGAYAHLVAFDEGRNGFAHLHPIDVDPLQRPDASRPTLNFKLTIPQPGRYVVWAQVNLGGREEFVPFWINVGPAS
jgi:hypothetical protein